MLQYELLGSPFRGEFRPDGRTWDSVIYVLVCRFCDLCIGVQAADSGDRSPSETLHTGLVF